MQGILDCLCDQDLFATKHWGTIQAIFLCAEAILARDFKMSSAQERCFLTVLLRLGAARMDDDLWHRKVQCVCSQYHCVLVAVMGAAMCLCVGYLCFNSLC